MGTGQIATLTPTYYDEVEKRVDFVATTTKGTSFKVVVQEIWWTTYLLKKLF